MSVQELGLGGESKKRQSAPAAGQWYEGSDEHLLPYP